MAPIKKLNHIFLFVVLTAFSFQSCSFSESQAALLLSKSPNPNYHVINNLLMTNVKKLNELNNKIASEGLINAYSSLKGNIDESLIKSDPMEPYRASLDPASLSPGSHEINVTAYNTNNITNSDTITVNVLSSGNEYTPPEVTITAPSNGAAVSNDVIVKVRTKDNVGISKVDLLVDNTLINTDTKAPYLFDWDSLKSSNGSHKITALAYDTEGNNSEHTILVTIDNPLNVPDVELTIINPKQNSVVTDTVSIQVEATSTSAPVEKVKFFINHKLVKVDIDAPYTYEWNTTEYRNGNQVIRAIANNEKGLKANERWRVKVKN